MPAVWIRVDIQGYPLHGEYFAGHPALFFEKYPLVLTGSAHLIDIPLDLHGAGRAQHQPDLHALLSFGVDHVKYHLWRVTPSQIEHTVSIEKQGIRMQQELRFWQQFTSWETHQCCHPGLPACNPDFRDIQLVRRHT